MTALDKEGILIQMNQLSLFRRHYTVTELTGYIRAVLEGEELLQDLWVQGEISNLSRPSSGHVYFTLKDAGASLRCVMWRQLALRQHSLPGDGEAVEVHGYISVYELGGQYQLYADSIRPLGEGLLYQEFSRLKGRLETEGLFDPERKRPVPVWPKCVGIVTSPTAAALRDVLNTLRRRFPLALAILAPTPVQGDDAPDGIVTAINALNQHAHPDVILLVRGGGSIEDLWAFNDERVARAIVASVAPVITGIGHETDFTIADFAADVRAPTPTAAAELVTPDQADLRASLAEASQRLGRAGRHRLAAHRSELATLQIQLRRGSPQARLRTDRQRLDELFRRASANLFHGLRLRQARLGGLAQRLAALNPEAVLRRGYAVVRHRDGRVVRRISQVAEGDRLHVRVSDGTFGAQVRESTDSS